ncbi:hypothetical protein [Rhodococcus sp. MALMAid1271]|uniref:hypothetical protein n=1 Tax=Rhodococcus sp. MALMAid1271 TaxID=3411744 RepID=UPI003B9E2B00
MSTPNPTHIDVAAMALLDALRNDETNWLNQRRWDPATARHHIAHVVSKLTDAGYSIAPTSGKHLEIEPDTEMRGVVCRECGWHLAGIHVDVDTQKRNHDEHVAAAEGEKA